MKIFSGLIIVTLLVLTWAVPAPAHPPESMSLSYDTRDAWLTVIIEHPVKGNDRHYISKIEIEVDRRLDNVYQFTRGHHENRLEERFRVLAEKGETIRVTAHCVRHGRIQEEMTVDTDPEHLSGAASGTPDPETSDGYLIQRSTRYLLVPDNSAYSRRHDRKSRRRGPRVFSHGMTSRRDYRWRDHPQDASSDPRKDDNLTPMAPPVEEGSDVRPLNSR